MNTTPTQTAPQDEAKPVAISLYQYQIDWLEAQKHKQLRKRDANRSKIVQDWVDKEIKKEQGKK